MTKLPCILTIAGSDSGGGAGIQADLKTISMLGGYGASVVTALTAQNTQTVTGIHAPSAKFVAQQLRTVLDDIAVSAAKTGMLFSEPIIKAIAPLLSKKKFPLVVDPVCVATSGARLLKEDAVKAMVKLVFPYADLLTPNIPEAELFTGVKIHDREDVFKAARLLLKSGPKAVLIKGGHSQSLAATDWYVVKDGEPIPYMQQRIDTDCTHGTGCTLSAAIATGLGQGLDIGAAIMRAQEYLNLALRAGYRLGKGGGPPNHLAPLLKCNARTDVIQSIDLFAGRLASMSGLYPLLSRVAANMVVALPWADCVEDVAGLTGGLIRTRRNSVLVTGYPEFGASIRTASVLLAGKRLRPNLSCAITLSLGQGVKPAFEQAGVEIAWIDRDAKPDYISARNGRFEEWGAFEAIKSYHTPEKVQAIGDPGGVGAEPWVRILADDVLELQALVCRIVDCLQAEKSI